MKPKYTVFIDGLDGDIYYGSDAVHEALRHALSNAEVRILVQIEDIKTAMTPSHNAAAKLRGVLLVTAQAAIEASSALSRMPELDKYIFTVRTPQGGVDLQIDRNHQVRFPVQA